MTEPDRRGEGGAASLVAAGLLTTAVGFASTFAIVLRGLKAVGASDAQLASGLCALLLAVGLLATGLSLWTRLPVSIAWSTPGAALLAATAVPVGGFPAALGAFLFASGLIVAAGLWRPFGRAIASLPPTLAAAMLAGILFGLCTAPVRAVAELPSLALPIIAAWALALRFARPYAVPIAVLLTLVAIAATTPLPAGASAIALPIAWTTPRFEPGALVGIGLPLFVVTMASQNVPGLAVMQANGYRPPVGLFFVMTGVASAAIAPFSALPVNLAAITAALCAGPDAHPDPSRRWLAAAISGGGYATLALGAGFASAFVAASPPILIESVAGLALLPTLAAALTTALSRDDHRLPAATCFVVSASGIAFAGIGPAFWGLLAGGTLLLIGTVGRRPVAPWGGTKPGGSP